MFWDREDRRRTHRHKFRPALDGRLEDRLLQARLVESLPTTLLHPIRTFVKDGGRAVRILSGHAAAFDAQITGPGTITAAPLPDGTIKLTLYGTDPTSVLDINPVRPRSLNLKQKNQAHEFHAEFGIGNRLLNVGEIRVVSGKINQILGYRTANLSGPLIIASNETVSRIAFNRLLPGATIVTGGDLDTLDVYDTATLSGQNTGINVGRDLNLLNVGGNLTITNNAIVFANRDIGNTTQPPKGSGTGSNVLQVLNNTLVTNSTTAAPLVGGFIQGNITVDPGSVLAAKRYIDKFVYVQGNLSGASRVNPKTLPGSTTPSFVVQGTVTA